MKCAQLFDYECESRRAVIAAELGLHFGVPRRRFGDRAENAVRKFGLAEEYFAD
jgi:hypothetical protein